MATQLEVKMDKEKFAVWLSKFRELIYELDQNQDEDGDWFYLTTVGFQIDEPSFEIEEQEE
ncbi:hypothetical protein D3C78_1882480 [compost metagenome]